MFAASLWDTVAENRKNHGPLYYNAYQHYLVHFVNSSADSRIQQATNYRGRRTGYRAVRPDRARFQQIVSRGESNSIVTRKEPS